MLNLKNFVLTLLLLFILSGCSRVQLVYNQLDWLIPYYINGYVELSENQDFYLNEQVSGLLKWHCSEHLTSYANLLRNANKKFQSGAMTSAQLEEYAAQFDSYWREIMHFSHPSLVDFFHTLSGEQVNALGERFRVDNSDWYDEFKNTSAETIQQTNLEFMQNELERWFGDLSEAQVQEVRMWSTEFRALGYKGQSAREVWQQRLLQTLAQRENLTKLNAGVTLLFVEPNKLRSKDYIGLMEQNTKVTIKLISTLSSSLTIQQRQHLDSTITTISEDFDALACTPSKVTQSNQQLFVAHN